MNEQNWKWQVARRRITLLVLLVLLPFVVIGVLRVEYDSTDMQQWLPEGQIQRKQYEKFIDAFGPDDTLIVSWPGCTLDDLRLSKLQAAYERFTSSAQREDSLDYFLRVSGGATVLRSLMSKPLQLEERFARARISRSLIGPDGNTTCLLLELSGKAKKNPERVIDAVFDTAKQACGLERDQLRVGGGVYEAVVIEQESSRALADFMWVSMVVAFFVAWISLRSLRLSLIVMGVAGYCTALTISLVYYFGGTMNAVMTVLPTLIFVLAISSAVHLVNYFRDAVADQGAQRAAIRGLSAGWLPCTLAALTTSIGMLSLLVSQIEPVRAFGFFSAIGIMASVVVVLFAIPVALETCYSRRPGPSDQGQISDAVSLSVSSAKRGIKEALIDMILRFRFVVLLGGVGLVAFIGYGLTRTTSSVKIERMFREDNELIRNYRWIEENIGPIASLEVVVSFSSSSPLRMVDRLALVQKIDRRLRRLPNLEATMSAGTVMPWVGSKNSLRSFFQRSVMDSELRRKRQQLVDDRLLADARGEELWRITAKLPAMQDLDYPAIIANVKRESYAVLAEHGQTGNETRIECTGAFPSISHGQKQLLQDLVNSFLLAFVLICPIMILILRSLLAGLVAMIGNVFPAVLVFGAMGWLAIPVELGTVLTGSIALGIAVDDTLHFLTWHQRCLSRGSDRFDSIREAFRRCATAMTQTTFICGLSMLVFTFSRFMPASRFSILMFALLFAALVGDLILLPAILASPLGWVFRTNQPIQLGRQVPSILKMH